MAHSRVVVTGGCGFVGSRLCAHLVENGHKVIIMDNFSRGTPANLPAAVLQAASIAVIDIRDKAAVTRCLEYYRPDTLYHLAALHFIPDCDADPAACISVNVDGTQAVLDASRGVSSIEAVILASSAAVYKPSETAHDETNELRPTDIYGHTKLWTEQLGHLFQQKTGIRLGIARLFNVFGPGETNPHLIPSIINQLACGNELRVGNLATQRDYVFVNDVASALVRFASACRLHGSITCNIGSERRIDGWQLVAAIEQLLSRRLTLQIDTARIRPTDRPSLLSNCQKAHELLGWYADTSLDEGLRAAFLQPIAQGFAA